MLLALFEIAAISTAPVTSSSAVDFTFLFLKMIAALVVAVVAAILVLKYAVPRLSLTKRFAGQGPIKILSRVSLGPKQQLFLVKIAERYILLGATDHEITKISEIEKYEGEKE